MPKKKSRNATSIKTVVVPQFVDLRGYLISHMPVNMCAGPNRDLWVLLQPGSGRDAPWRPDWSSSSCEYLILCIQDSGITQIAVTDEHLHHYFVQPLPNDQFLLASSRFEGKGDHVDEMNARVFKMDGEYSENTFSVGDGVGDLQTTTNGNIWVSYFDEGVFSDSNALSGSGLSCFDATGRRVYEFKPRDGLDWICDCYVLNVQSDSDVWIHYYSQFPVVHIRDCRIHSWWESPIHSANALAIHAGSVLMARGHAKRSTSHLLSLTKAGKLEEVGVYRFVDSEGNNLAKGRVIARADLMYFATECAVHRISIRDLV